jgi:hypothetical protein
VKIFFWILLFSTQASADSTVSLNNVSCLQNLFEGKLHIVHLDPDLPLSTDAQIKRVIFRVDHAIEGHLRAPSHVRVEVKSSMVSPHADNGTISIARQIELTHNLKTDPQYFETILAHEYGHLVLRENLKDTPSILKILDLHRTSKIKQKAFRNVFRAYDEFFADVVASLYAADGSAVRTSLTPVGVGKGELESANVRDFIFHHRLDSWNYEGPYSRLSPSRNFLWSILKRNSERVTKNPGEVLGRVDFAMKEQLKRQIWDMNYGEEKRMNEKFIASLKHAFSDYKQ